jgi:hypothetical protein
MKGANHQGHEGTQDFLSRLSFVILRVLCGLMILTAMEFAINRLNG